MSTTWTTTKAAVMMKNPAHPGEVLREEVLRDLGLSVNQCAEALGVSRVSLSRVLNARASLSPQLALRLETAGLGSARMWLDMQSAWDLAQLRETGLPAVSRLGHDVSSRAQ
ncbi:HigA family addiction module antitoxin [Pontimonas sp.]|uniref:HigA family addiction module antitoxin n=2 Tax=Pontimonas sp. TaxID=2304492 RepID=UPI0028707406|nr:HigA family addiction module antitoxin [Pontimonas sp.]MDR9397189.1 HigA family addiction module antitoxin [Pontimonas sp.]